MGAKGESLRDLVQLQKKMNHLFEEMLQPERQIESLPEYTWVPAADVFEDATHYAVELEVPGVSIQDIDIVCQGSLLRVSGERKSPVELTRESVQRIERYVGLFAREFSFPEVVDSSKAEAGLKDGVLSVKIPKGPRRSIQVG